MNRVGELEVDQDLNFLGRAWKVQRVGWAVMLLLVLAALLGLLGRGPLSRATVGREGDPVRLEYSRITRHSSPEVLKIHLAPGVAKNEKVRVWIDRRYIQDMRIEDINPEPESVEASEEGLVYVFAVADPKQETTVAFHVQPGGYLLRDGRVGLDGREPLSFRQFVLP